MTFLSSFSILDYPKSDMNCRIWKILSAVFITLFSVVALGGLGYKLWACYKHDRGIPHGGNAHGRGDSGYIARYLNSREGDLCIGNANGTEGNRVANGYTAVNGTQEAMV